MVDLNSNKTYISPSNSFEKVLWIRELWNSLYSEHHTVLAWVLALKSRYGKSAKWRRKAGKISGWVSEEKGRLKVGLWGGGWGRLEGEAGCRWSQSGPRAGGVGILHLCTLSQDSIVYTIQPSYNSFLLQTQYLKPCKASRGTTR